MEPFDYAAYIADIPDYPEPGVVFKDITPLFADPVAMRHTVEAVSYTHLDVYKRQPPH